MIDVKNQKHQQAGGWVIIFDLSSDRCPHLTHHRANLSGKLILRRRISCVISRSPFF